MSPRFYCNLFNAVMCLKEGLLEQTFNVTLVLFLFHVNCIVEGPGDPEMAIFTKINSSSQLHLLRTTRFRLQLSPRERKSKRREKERKRENILKVKKYAQTNLACRTWTHFVNYLNYVNILGLHTGHLFHLILIPVQWNCYTNILKLETIQWSEKYEFFFSLKE